LSVGDRPAAIAPPTAGTWLRLRTAEAVRNLHK